MPVYRSNGTQQQCGHAIGILCMDEYLPFPPGCMNNASTFDFPVLYKLVPGWHSVDVIQGNTGKFLRTMIEKARELESDGVRGITANCGYALRHQQEIAEAVRIPVALSSLLQLPIISGSIGPERPIGIMCAAAPPLSAQFIEECGVRVPNPLVVYGLQDEPAFKKLLEACGLGDQHEDKLVEFDFDAICADVVGVARRLQSEHPDTGAILFECSEFPPYAEAVQHATRLPVFDFVTMVDLMQAGTHPRARQGFM